MPAQRLRHHPHKRKATVFLGGGRITSALIGGLRLARYQRPLVVYDRNSGKLRALQRGFQAEIESDLASAVARAEMLVIAVRPVSVRQLLEEVADCGVAAPRLCVSLAAGVPLRNLRAQLGMPVHWVRAMPSPVCRIRRGLTPVTFDHNVTKSERTRVRKFFEHVGPVLELPERQLDAITATHSPTHGYHALATLAKAAQDAGLDRKTALMAAAHALGDGIAYWAKTGQRLEELLHEAATPGGIAAATIAAMEKSGYGTAVKRGLQAGIAQARRNAKL
jgi:pyrroline-5-carboxylate reductase